MLVGLSGVPKPQGALCDGHVSSVSAVLSTGRLTRPPVQASLAETSVPHSKGAAVTTCKHTVQRTTKP